MASATDRHGLEVLTYAQSMALLRSRAIGRIAYLDAGQPTVVPVNHLVDGSSVVMRTMAGGKLDAAVVGHAVAFQLDDHDPARGTGWSVLVRGRADLLEDVERIAHLETELDSWAIDEGGEAAWIRIVPDEVSGRRLRRG
ncbi:MAG: pyridoxamine 5'-phosphate oxidase family protein [Nitriliruptoraceae bacterium]|nr:pyridoxamine 5'-phosphate oxidase family protein [Nitriliruptoraceae bacterium]